MDNTYAVGLRGGETALIDYADAELVAGFRWYLGANGYVYADRFCWRIALHRLIAGPREKEHVDHINGDPLDNRSSNLRIATPSQNSANRGADRRRGGTTSRYKGVSWSTSKNRWVVYIHVNGKTRYVGRSLDEVTAADMYDRAAVATWGEFARLNHAVREEIVTASDPAL